MAIDEGLVAWVTEAMAPEGVVTRRAMMGGATLYLDGAVFAITPVELAQSDACEVEDYRRERVRLASGLEAWAYVDARSRPG
jgi:TfoX/Sxy family transcriptional regulator of competence genes